MEIVRYILFLMCDRFDKTTLEDEIPVGKRRTFMKLFRKEGLIAICLCISMVAGCSARDDRSNGSEATSETSASAPAETQPTEETVYVHGEDGYFSQIDNGISTPVQDQGYTPHCWAYATFDVLRLTNQTIYGEDIDPEAFGITDLRVLAYGEKDEGVRIMEGSNVNDVAGGSDMYITWVMTNGYQGYTVIENPTLVNCDISENEDDPLMTNAATLDQIKEMLRTKGALPIVLSGGAGRINYKDYALVNDDNSLGLANENGGIKESHCGHEALIVGYDDNFPKEYFGQYGHRTPSIDGAWLYKESAGETWGDGGYAWVSYESSFVVDGYIVLSQDYSKVLSYENSVIQGVNTGDKTTVANVWHDSGKLAAVGTYVGVSDDLSDDLYGMKDEDDTITIKVMDEDMTEVLAEKTVTFDFDGYYVVELDEPVDVDGFSVVVTYSGNAPFESESLGQIRSSLEYYTTAEKGQTFIMIDGQWYDTSEASTSELLGIEEVLNNAGIKALFVD